MQQREAIEGRRRATATRLGCLVLAAMVLSATLAGCGDSGSDAQAVEARIARERAEAAATARQAQKLVDLQDEVERLRRARRRAHTIVRTAEATAPPEAGAGASPGRVFHAPFGNVSCQLDARSASCTVAATGTTFVLPPSGSLAYVEQGTALARGSGDLVDWGTSVSVGPVNCRVPEADEPSGVTCVDTSSGHGFEASRVTARQKAY